MRIIGGGPLEPRLQELARCYGQVDLVGFVDEEKKADIMARSEIFISLSDFEPMGVVFVEALLSGCKIVAPHCGGHREFIPVGYPFVACESGDVASIAAAMNEAATKPALEQDVDSRIFDYAGSIAPAYLAELRESHLAG
jgi:glycosyltransferase involved in cell wall biosynthesis